jgi:hypothetical protein
MRKLVFISLVAALALPAWAAAGSRPSSADRAAASARCTGERQNMGAQAFKLLYGTNANRSNAFGKCVSKLAQQNAQNGDNAAAQCRAERAADPQAFKDHYGTNANKSNAFGKCVSSKAKAQGARQDQATDNAAKQCMAERQADPAAFKDHYGTNANKSNAFGKCVSSKVKHTP